VALTASLTHTFDLTHSDTLTHSLSFTCSFLPWPIRSLAPLFSVLCSHSQPRSPRDLRISSGPRPSAFLPEEEVPHSGRDLAEEEVPHSGRDRAPGIGVTRRPRAFFVEWQLLVLSPVREGESQGKDPHVPGEGASLLRRERASRLHLASIQRS
jgi:hypothetical protein